MKRFQKRGVALRSKVHNYSLCIFENTMADNNDVEQTNQPDQQTEQSIAPSHDVNEKRNMICFWIVGLCNTYGPMVLMSAAYDIIKRLNGISVRNQ